MIATPSRAELTDGRLKVPLKTVGIEKLGWIFSH